MLIHIHPENPQQRLVQQVVAELERGALIAYPTDSGYAFGWRLGNREARDRVARLRDLGHRHDFTLVMSDLASVARFAQVGNVQFRLMRKLMPGPYTFILPATREVPKSLLHPKRRSIGIRVPDHPVAHALLEANGEALTSSSLLLPELDIEYLSVDELQAELEDQVDVFVHSGPCPLTPTTVIDLRDDVPEILRRGAGAIEFLES